MTRKTKLSYLLLGLVFTLGLFLRFFRLNLNLPSLYADEVSHYYYLQNLRSQGTSFFLKIFDLLFTGTWLVGLNPLGVRMLSAIYGSLAVIFGFFFAKTITKTNNSKQYLRVAIVYALLISMIPWSFSLSRLGHTHISFIILMTFLHVTLYLNSVNWKTKIISLIPFLVGSYLYPSLMVISPIVLFFPLLDILKSSHLQKKYIYIGSFAIIVAIFGVLSYRYKISDPNRRGLDLAIWRDPNVTSDSNLYRGEARLSSPTIFSFNSDTEKLANKLVFNYPISVASTFSKNYLSFFSPDFLFIKGDNILRHSTGMVGELYLFLLPFMAYGIFVFFRDQTTKNKMVFLTWILASPIPAAITKDGATYLLRAVTLMPFLTYFCALGVVTIYEATRSNLIKVLYTLTLSFIMLFSSYYYFYGYFHVYPALSANSFEFGFKELADFQSDNPGKMLIVWEDKYPFAHFCFWQNLPYSVCEFSKTNTRVQIGQTRVDLPLPNVLFSLPISVDDLKLITQQYSPKYIAVPSKYKKLLSLSTKNFKVVRVILNPDQSVAFEIYTN